MLRLSARSPLLRGQEMLAGIDYRESKNGDPRSVFYQHVDLSRIGSTGHSQGGGGAIAAGADPRVDTTIPIQPGPQGDVNKLSGSVLFLAGRLDFIVVPELLVYPRYLDAEHIPAGYAELYAGTHFTPAGDAGAYRGPITAWRYFLMADQQVRGLFFGAGCGLCTDTLTWRYEPNAEAAATPGP